MGGRGSGGHNRKPAALKKLQGNPGKRRLNLNEPAPPPGRPEMPKGLVPEAVREWDRIVPLLEQMLGDTFTVVDGTVVAAYCSCYAQWRQADRHVAKFGIVLATVDEETGQSFLKTNPAVRVRSDALRLMNTFLSKLGLDPRSRAGLTINDTKGSKGIPHKQDKLEQFLADARGAGGDGSDEGNGKKPN